MSPLDENYERIARHYNESIFEYESVRLPDHSPIEFGITTRQLKRWIPEKATVADVGVGVGHYAEILARRGCWIYLVDISQRLLDTAYARLKKLGLHQQVAGIHQTSATGLKCLEAEELDAVLLLGPLYHLCSLSERQQAIEEVSHVLKPAGLIFAAGINRLAYFRELFRATPDLVLQRQNFHQQLLQDGNVDPLHTPPLGYGHLTTCKELRQLLTARFDEITLLGVESFTAPWQEAATKLTSTELEEWLDLVEATASTPEGLGMADHFLFIGQRL